MIGSVGEVIDFLAQRKNAVIVSHERPDGDALGASLALGRILRANGWTVVVLGFEPLAPRYLFMLEPGEITPRPGIETYNADVLIALDCGDLSRAGGINPEMCARLPVVNIDHHQTNDSFGIINWVDPDASSAGEMIYRLARTWGLNIPASAALPLWVAISTDTGYFSFSNTTAEVMRIGAELLDMGVRPELVRRELDERMAPREIKLMQRCLERLTVHSSGKIAYICLTRADFEEFGASPQDLHDPVNIARAIDGVSIAFVAYEMPEEDKVKVSMRTYSPYDAAEFCGDFGGGGHARAAGFSVEGGSARQVAEDVLSALEHMRV